MNPIKDPTELSGMLGETVTMRKINGRVVIKNRPRRRIVADPTPKQIVVQGKFKEAQQWASAQMKKPDVKALYAAKITTKVKSAFMAAVTDYLNPPEVQDIDVSNYKGAQDKLVMLAHDLINLNRRIRFAGKLAKTVARFESVDRHWVNSGIDSSRKYRMSISNLY